MNKFKIIIYLLIFSSKSFVQHDWIKNEILKQNVSVETMNYVLDSIVYSSEINLNEKKKIENFTYGTKNITIKIIET